MYGKRRGFRGLARGEVVELPLAEIGPKKIWRPDEEVEMGQEARKVLRQK